MEQEFKANIVEKDGKRYLNIQSNSEEIVYPDGRKDIIIHAPSLSLVNKFMEAF